MTIGADVQLSEREEISRGLWPATQCEADGGVTGTRTVNGES